MIEHGMITWSELMTTDVEKAKAFYSQALGVSFEKFNDPEGKYWAAMAGGTVTQQASEFASCSNCLRSSMSR